jgi:GH25 family lysozyme M1 (1,4-beta-N-acetylmuramidase)
MEIAHTFMTEMVERGYYPGLYTNNNLLYNIYNSEKTLRLYDVWFARYPGSEPDEATIKEYSAQYSIWQYMGSVEGFAGGAVEGFCDLNYAFKNYPEIMKKHGFNGY